MLIVCARSGYADIHFKRQSIFFVQFVYISRLPLIRKQFTQVFAKSLIIWHTSCDIIKVLPWINVKLFA